MKKRNLQATSLIILALTAFLTSTCVLADKGGKHGNGNKHDDQGRDGYYQDNRNDSVSIQLYFGDNDRRLVNDYYGHEFHSGHCPPGLAKKHNGCMPPGQAKKWRKGYALPGDVVYYPLPQDLVRRLPPPPPRHRYVRVGGDVLLLSGGSSIVVDVIVNIGY